MRRPAGGGRRWFSERPYRAILFTVCRTYVRPREDSGRDDRVVPNPAQDYFENQISLDRHLVGRRPTSTFVLRVSSSALASMGIHSDELDRALSPRPDGVLVVLLDDERRLGRFDVDGVAVLATDHEQIPLTSDVEPWGVATVAITSPSAPPGRERRNVAR